jgi:hypothetical protein
MRDGRRDKGIHILDGKAELMHGNDLPMTEEPANFMAG